MLELRTPDDSVLLDAKEAAEAIAAEIGAENWPDVNGMEAVTDFEDHLDERLNNPEDDGVDEDDQVFYALFYGQCFVQFCNWSWMEISLKDLYDLGEDEIEEGENDVQFIVVDPTRRYLINPFELVGDLCDGTEESPAFTSLFDAVMSNNLPDAAANEMTMLS